MARVTVVSGAMRTSTNGTVTAPTDGGNFPLWSATESFEIWDLPDMSTWRAIREGGVDCVIFVEYEGTDE